ncbi:ABC transporter family substrate-binding protein [Schumannella luteola]|uniref:Peptide/nickel transport system substrate-binding protein n=1 Tax=Schumannella luteola TaxID=472059 RepID=A0A852YQI0_9MICO|nr:ABC transporter family substrate-binding protein [Schumannella luteola]NYG99475.1 peptide/nickel transport system substrate-binding protein [Schumannella luteola]TPX03802.1 ABC transporter family substrate-binding protein [Schumannella luteola]
MVSMRKPGLVIASLAIAGLALAGCSAGGGNDASTSPSDTTKLPSTGWEKADYDQVKDGGKLTLPIDTFPANWQTYNLDAGTVDDALLSTLYLPSLITVKEDGTWEPNKDYVTSLELASEDPQVVDIKFNPQAKWSDGTPLSADDIAANWNALKSPDTDFAPTSSNVWEDISSVEPGADQSEVKLTFKNKNADWPSIFGPIYPKWAVDTPDHFNNLWKSQPVAADGTTIVSGGPYIISSLDANAQVVTFTKNPAWWGEQPKLDTIIFKSVSRNGLAQAFANKEIDAFNLYGSADNLKTAEARSDAEIQRSLGTTFRHVTLNGTSDVFKDVKVRQAFAKSLQRDVLAQAILKPVGSPVTVLGNLVYLPGQKGYEDDAQSVIGYDVDGAKKLLEEAGWKQDGNVAKKDGKALTVRFVIPSENQNSANVAQLVKQQAAKAGFKVDIDVVPSDDFFTKYVTTETRDFDATYFAWQGTPFPVSSVKSIYYPANSGQNYPGVTDKSLGKAFDTANAELDADKRVTEAQKIDKKLVNLVTTVPLFPEPYAWGVTKGLVNYGPSQFEVQNPPWTRIGWKS